MDWQTQQRQIYQQQQAEKELAKQQAAEQQRNLLKAQFEAQARLAAEQTAERERQSEEQRNREQQQQTAALQRIANDLRLSNEQREARQREAQERLKQLETPRIWKSQDSREFRSPLEASFWNTWIEDSTRRDEIPLVPQHQIGRYRVDFAHISTKTIIEIDGQEWHSRRQDRNKDYARQHWLEDQGWHFIRFTGSQISTDSLACVLYVHRRIMAGVTHPLKPNVPPRAEKRG